MTRVMAVLEELHSPVVQMVIGGTLSVRLTWVN
jgi:hypothetical protein